jgi:hypothetical protein
LYIFAYCNNIGLNVAVGFELGILCFPTAARRARDDLKRLGSNVQRRAYQALSALSLAHGASLMAIASQRDVKREYLTLAENWLQFAEAIERESK